jgi:hypothetical protein
MSISKRKDSAGRNYYINTTTGKRTTEASYKRSKGAAKSAKTQFKTATGYVCSKAGRDLKVKNSPKAAATLASKRCDRKK